MTEKTTRQGIVTRFAPSPTGFLHIGGARTALFNYLFTKKNGGKSILRIEDTDKERSTKEYEEDITDNLKWLGLTFDEKVRQSDRLEIHQKYLEKLIKDGFAYVSKEIPRESGEREEVIRFKNPNKKVKFQDLIRGEVEFDTSDLKDFVIAKSITEPIFHLAVVVDDFEMGVTHVIRGEDHISNTPRQILIQEAIGAPRPIYAHIPLILSEDRSKLSKRKHGESVSVDFYKNQGYLPEALVNFMALLGWNPGTPEEIFLLDELVKKFDISKVQKGGAIFDTQKLNWLNKQYITKMPAKKFGEIFSLNMKPEYSDKKILSKIAPMVQERVEKFSDIVEMKKTGEFDYFFSEPKYDGASLVWKKGGTKEKTVRHLEEVKKIILKISDADFTADAVKSAVSPYAEKEGRGDVFWPFRFSLSGKEKSPDPFTLSEILGKKETIERLDSAIKKVL